MSFRIEINPELKMKSDIMFKAFYGRKEKISTVFFMILWYDRASEEEKT